MRQYQATLDRLRRDFSGARRIDGGHGESVEDPLAKLDEYIEHRKNREREIVAVVEEGPATIAAIVERVYHGISQTLWPAAARQVLAYLIALEREGRVRARRLDRAPTPSEAAILNPDLSRIVDPSSRAVVAAELGIDRSVTTIEEYALR
jgi:glyoxylase-like metal-dependent hydrolase (beta-lactamase superfamily II)